MDTCAADRGLRLGIRQSARGLPDRRLIDRIRHGRLVQRAPRLPQLHVLHRLAILFVDRTDFLLLRLREIELTKGKTVEPAAVTTMHPSRAVSPAGFLPASCCAPRCAVTSAAEVATAPTPARIVFILVLFFRVIVFSGPRWIGLSDKTV